MDSKGLNLVKITNPFDRRNREISNVPFRGETAGEVRRKYLPAEVRFHVSLNGKLLPDDELDHTYLFEGDYLVFVPLIECGGDNGFLRFLATIVVVVAAIATSVLTKGALTPFWAGVLGAGVLFDKTGHMGAMSLTVGNAFPSEVLVIFGVIAKHVPDTCISEV